MNEEVSLLLLDKALQGLGFMKLTRYVIHSFFYCFSLIDFLFFLKKKQWFDRQKTYLDSLESQLRGLVKAIEVVVKHRSGMFPFLKIDFLFQTLNKVCLSLYLYRVSRFFWRICTNRQRSFCSRCGQAIVPVVGRFSRC